MPRPKKTQGIHPLGRVLANVPSFPHRAGLPAKDSVTSVTTPKPAAAMPEGGARAPVVYRIIHTTEMDEYERDALSPSAFTAAAQPTGDNFQGTDRKAAKLSIANAPTKPFDGLKTLIESLDDEESMISHDPPITIDAKSNRVKEERRNIRVAAFIYAASKEKDNDFHLIVGRDPEETPEIYMTMELSGLPQSSMSSFGKLNAARTAFKQFFDDNFEGNLPGLQYDFYDPPIPVTIEGSLFFDMTHATGTRPGPKSLKSRMPVIWEVHPITKMLFQQ